jgi:hypothetical protein
LPTIDQMSGLLDTIDTGGFQKVVVGAGRLFGVEPANAAEFDSLAKEMVLGRIKMLGANPTEGERGFLEQVGAGLNAGGTVNKRMLSRLKKISQDQLQRGILAAEDIGDNTSLEIMRSKVGGLGGDNKPEAVGQGNKVGRFTVVVE